MRNKLDALYTIKVKKDEDSERAYNIYKNMYLQRIRNERKLRNEKYIRESDNKLKAIWIVINSETKQRNNKLLRNESNIASANDFNSFFSSIGNVTSRNIGTPKVNYKDLLKNKTINNFNTIYFADAIEDEIRGIIAELKKQKNGGYF